MRRYTYIYKHIEDLEIMTDIESNIDKEIHRMVDVEWSEKFRGMDIHREMGRDVSGESGRNEREREWQFRRCL